MVAGALTSRPYGDAYWLQGKDLNLRPRGYEPRALTRLRYPAKLINAGDGGIERLDHSHHEACSPSRRSPLGGGSLSCLLPSQEISDQPLVLRAFGKVLGLRLDRAPDLEAVLLVRFPP